MALISCRDPECGKKVSSMATMCPHCGCPLAPSTPPSGPSSSSVSSTAAIAELEQIVHDAQRSLLSAVEANVVASRIAARKRALFVSQDAFVAASVETGTLVLSDDDVGILARLSPEDLLRVKNIYALACTRFANEALKRVWLCRGLEVLDLSYCANIDDAGMDPRPEGDFRAVVQLAALREVYLRSCPGVTNNSGITLLAVTARNLESLFLDGNRHLDHMTFEVFMHCKLHLLSIRGCSGIIESTGTFNMMVTELCPDCRIIGP